MAENCGIEFASRYYSHHTTPKCVCLILKWTVRNYSSLYFDKEYEFPSVRLSPQCDLEVSFLKKNKNHIFLYVKNNVDFCLNLAATTRICDDSGNTLFEEGRKDLALMGKYDFLCNLRDLSVFPEPLPNDCLIFYVKFDIFNLKSEIFEKSDKAACETETGMKLSKDMKDFILAEHPEEVVLKTKDAQIPVNKAMLRARSSVFRKMFDHPMTEKKMDVVHVDDLNGATIKCLVEFLHSGKTELSKFELQSLKELYYAADKYDVLDLREICSQSMLAVMTEENAIGVLVLAHQHSDECLKNKCLVFIGSCIQAVMKTEGWRHLKMSDPGLAMEVLESSVNVSADAVQE